MVFQYWRNTHLAKNGRVFRYAFCIYRKIQVSNDLGPDWQEPGPTRYRITSSLHCETEQEIEPFTGFTSVWQRNAFTPVAFYSADTHYSRTKVIQVLGIHSFCEIGNLLYEGHCPLGGPRPTEIPSRDVGKSDLRLGADKPSPDPHRQRIQLGHS